MQAYMLRWQGSSPHRISPAYGGTTTASAQAARISASSTEEAEASPTAALPMRLLPHTTATLSMKLPQAEKMCFSRAQAQAQITVRQYPLTPAQ